MDEASDAQAVRSFLSTVQVGDRCGGVVTALTPSRGAAVTLDGFPARPLGSVGPSEMPWGRSRSEAAEIGRRITAEVIAVDLDEGLVRLSTAATENPELWTFLKRLVRGEVLSGTVAAIESFGVFVALDEGPGHPVFPGVGFITIPELSWRPFGAATDIVRVGERVSCEFLQSDTWNGEARLSLRAMRPDPFQAFADRVSPGQALHGTVTRLVPFGAFVEVADGIEGLVHLDELAPTPVRRPEDVVRAGDEVTAVAIVVDRVRRRLALSLTGTAEPQQEAPAGPYRVPGPAKHS